MKSEIISTSRAREAQALTDSMIRKMRAKQLRKLRRKARAWKLCFLAGVLIWILVLNLLLW